ncbi:MAG: dTDP-4-dehydrorhamnose 3,5-epimerase [Tannerellaceae bacterium]|jgi:dTDP-4-dehydrorhamnose 3,5-epimerase|nr:dTDP-4-dehydrorhamnose 3,5-epimerase [Tannerellaceae bacterium]
MKYIETHIPDVRIIEPEIFHDCRGYFFETYRMDELNQSIGHMVNFIQENESCSSKGVLRGLHFQLNPYSQAKLVRVIKGTVLDVVVDLRKCSHSFGQHVAVELSEENKRQLFIPRGFAHGFHVLSDEVVFTYKVDNSYRPDAERCIRYNDPDLNIDWKIPCGSTPILSAKDMNAPLLAESNSDLYL